MQDYPCRYASYAFRSMLRKHNVTQSFSKPGCPHDNAAAEAFFASIKKEEFKLNTYDTISDLRTAVDGYMDFYNDYRPHQRLGYKTPNEYEKEKAGGNQTVQ